MEQRLRPLFHFFVSLCSKSYGINILRMGCVEDAECFEGVICH